MTQDQLHALAPAARAKGDAVVAQIRKLGSALVAFSGGVDSALLLALARQALGARAIAFTAISPAIASDELDAARAVAKQLGAEHIERRSHELDDARYAANPNNRCYFCKTELYGLAESEARALGISAILAGTNADELHDHRPGLIAAQERAILQPLADAQMTKDEIRALSLQLGLPTWDKPQQPCLSSRIPYGTAVTAERLAQLAQSEMGLRALGLREFRVRYHGELARIEVADAELPRLLEIRGQAATLLRAAGFRFVSVDLEAFRSGRLNEAAGLVPLGGNRNRA